jgi:hypothetical protein
LKACNEYSEDLLDLRFLLLNRVSLIERFDKALDLHVSSECRVSLIENLDKAVDLHVLSSECRVLRISREEHFDELRTSESIYRKEVV